jgi:hypothetical protein
MTYNPGDYSLKKIDDRDAAESIVGRTIVDTEDDLYKKYIDQGEYLDFEDSLEIARRFTAGDPSEPDSRIASDIHASVADELGIEDYSELKMYSGMQTPLADKHKVHGVLELGKKEDDIRITMNALLDEEQAEKIRERGGNINADILLGGVPDYKAEKEEYKEYLKNITEEITNKFKEEQAEKERRDKEQAEFRRKIPGLR